MNAKPRDLEEFKNLEQADKCTWMYMTLMNHLGDLKEIKWWIRGLGIAVVVAIIREIATSL